MHDIRKSVQPHNFFGGINLKPKIVVTFLGNVIILFDEGLLKKEKMIVIFFLLREENHRLWTHVNKDMVETLVSVDLRVFFYHVTTFKT